MARSPNQGHSKELQSPHKEGPNVLRARTACPVYLPCFLVILFPFVCPFEGRGRGERVGRELAEEGLEEVVNEASD